MDMDETPMDSSQESDSDLRDEDPDQFAVDDDIDDRRTIANVSRTLNILDILNDDCWMHILDYVPTENILCLKSVSREWQAMVHRYMQGARLRIETIANVWDVDEAIRRRKCRVFILNDDSVSLIEALHEWGDCVRELVYDANRSSEASLMDLGKKCPNLEDITFVRLRWHTRCDWVTHFTRLKRVCFENSSMTDSCVQEFLKNNAIEGLVIRMSDLFVGEFFAANKENKNGDLTKLKTLVLNNCKDLKFSNLLSAVVPVNRLTGVTKLELRCYFIDLPSQMSMLLDKMPQLEHLTLDCECLFDEETVAAVTRLDRLKHLGWYKGAVFRGKELQAVRKDTTPLTSRPACPARCYPLHVIRRSRSPIMGQLDADLLRLARERNAFYGIYRIYGLII